MKFRVHDLKTWPHQFRELRSGRKTAEFRKNDRGFCVGDYLVLREWIPTTERYTGECLFYEITNVEAAQEFGIPEDYAMLSLRPQVGAAE